MPGDDDWHEANWRTVEWVSASRRESLIGTASADDGTTASAVTTGVSSKRKLEAVFFAAALCVTASFLVTNDQPRAVVEVFVFVEANND